VTEINGEIHHDLRKLFYQPMQLCLENYKNL